MPMRANLSNFAIDPPPNHIPLLVAAETTGAFGRDQLGEYEIRLTFRYMRQTNPERPDGDWIRELGPDFQKSMVRAFFSMCDPGVIQQEVRNYMEQWEVYEEYDNGQARRPRVGRVRRNTSGE